MQTRLEEKSPFTQNPVCTSDERCLLLPGGPPQAGELRFKKCESVERFHEGEDLQVDTGQPWSLPLLNIVRSSSRKAFLHELLVEPGLVDQELVADLQHIFGGSKAKDPGNGLGFNRGGLTLYDIDQPFVTDVNIAGSAVRLVTRQSIQMLEDLYMFWPSAGRANSAVTTPVPWYIFFFSFFGSAVSDRIGLILTHFLLGRVRARFEFEDCLEDKGRLTLRLRILDILKPIERCTVQHLMLEPRAGELLLKRQNERLDFTPWSFSPRITGQNHKALVEFLKCRAADKAKFGV